MRHVLTLALCLLAAWCGDACVPALAQRAKKETVKVEATAVTIDWLMQSGYGPERLVEAGSSINCGGLNLKVIKGDDGQLGINYKKEWLTIPAAGTTLEVAGKGGPAHIAIYPDFADRLHWFGGDAVTAKFGELELLLIDGNLNGTFTDIGEDYIARGPRGGFALPMTETVPLVDYVYSFKEQRARGGATLMATRIEFTTKADSRKLQNALNEVRLDFGLLTTTSDAAADKGCEAHCTYMNATGKLGHVQDPKHEAFTKEGDQAARTSLLTTKTTPEGAIRLWLSSPLHGREVRARWLTIAGFGFKDGYACLRVKSLSPKGMELERGVAFPPDGADNVPLSWSVKESPEPRIDTSKEPGYPITFCASWNEPFLPEAFACKLQKLSGEKWEDVPAQVSFPGGKDYPATMGTHKHAFVLPLEPLVARAIYRIDATYSLGRRQDARVVSTFRTSSSDNARSWDTRQQR